MMQRIKYRFLRLFGNVWGFNIQPCSAARQETQLHGFLGCVPQTQVSDFLTGVRYFQMIHPKAAFSEYQELISPNNMVHKTQSPLLLYNEILITKTSSISYSSSKSVSFYYLNKTTRPIFNSFKTDGDKKFITSNLALLYNICHIRKVCTYMDIKLP